MKLIEQVIAYFLLVAFLFTVLIGGVLYAILGGLCLGLGMFAALICEGGPLLVLLTAGLVSFKLFGGFF